MNVITRSSLDGHRRPTNVMQSVVSAASKSAESCRRTNVCLNIANEHVQSEGCWSRTGVHLAACRWNVLGCCWQLCQKYLFCIVLVASTQSRRRCVRLHVAIEAIYSKYDSICLRSKKVVCGPSAFEPSLNSPEESESLLEDELTACSSRVFVSRSSACACDYACNDQVGCCNIIYKTLPAWQTENV